MDKIKKLYMIMFSEQMYFFESTASGHPYKHLSLIFKYFKYGHPE